MSMIRPNPPRRPLAAHVSMVMLMLLVLSILTTAQLAYLNYAHAEPPSARPDLFDGPSPIKTDANALGLKDSRPNELLASPGPELLAAVESALVDVIGRCEQSVVAISRVRADQAPRSPLDSFRFGPSSQLSSSDPTSEDFIPTFFGSGIVLSEDGLIVTCAHVLDDPNKHRYFVWLDRRCYPATVAGKPAQVLASDPFSDLAVLKIDASDLQPLPVATDKVQKGNLVIALGNPHAIARDGRVSASFGMVANVHRMAPRESDQLPTESIHQLGTLIHTDLKTPVGSSGGALVNWKGELVGITTNLLAGSGQEHPAGLAIATDEFYLRVLESLKRGKQPEYGFLGIQPENLRESEIAGGLRGARVSMVIPGLPGSEAGLREGDIIFQVGETSIHNRSDLFRELSKVSTGTNAKLLVHRRGITSSMQLVELEAELSKKFIATSRPATSLHGPPTWRGAQVEYHSAIAGELERTIVARSGVKVAFLNVVPNSPVWQAGLRSGYGIVKFDGQTISTPDQFNELAADAERDVTLVVMTTDGKQLSVVVQPESKSP